jgi:pimeloyl-ACP methyl ester carboxylesterase
VKPKEAQVKRISMTALAVSLPVLLLLAVVQSAGAAATPYSQTVGTREDIEAAVSDCERGRQSSGAEYLICSPTSDSWNGDLIVYAHGYVAPDEPVEIPQDQMVIEGYSVTETATLLGYGFATTSYRMNGLAVRPAISDLLDVVSIFSTKMAKPDKIYLLGVSEGGLITALSVEQHPDLYDGGLAMCGPYGDFRGQIDHFGDFRVVFDYFFPELMPGSAISMPEDFMKSWESGFFSTTIKPEITDPDNITRVNQFLTVTNVSPYAYEPPTSTNSIAAVLQYNVFATNDGIAKLGGQPFDNQDRQYNSSNNDALLNDPEEGVARFSADQAALDEIDAHYQTSGELSVPLVTLHTTGDPVVPYWHANHYLSKTIATAHNDLHARIPVTRHGHCNFEIGEILDAFSQLVDMVAHRHRVFLPVALKHP